MLFLCVKCLKATHLAKAVHALHNSCLKLVYLNSASAVFWGRLLFSCLKIYWRYTWKTSVQEEGIGDVLTDNEVFHCHSIIIKKEAFWLGVSQKLYCLSFTFYLSYSILSLVESRGGFSYKSPWPLKRMFAIACAILDFLQTIKTFTPQVWTLILFNLSKSGLWCGKEQLYITIKQNTAKNENYIFKWFT